MGADLGQSRQRALVALEDFFIRYHWALVSADDALRVRRASGPDTDGLLSRTLAIMCDTRVVALNALEDITFVVPLSTAGPVRRAVEAARRETLACLEVLATRLSQTDPVAAQVASVAWRGPVPNDEPTRRHDLSGAENQLH